MNRNLTIILGASFILMSGLVFSLERLAAHVHWLPLTNTGTYPTESGTTLLNHLVSIIFLVIGLSFLVTITNKKETH